MNQYGDSNLPEVSLSAASIVDDLGPQGRPLWKLSAYAPARGEPNLISGKDVSPDELRVMAYQARASGQEAQYVQHEQKLMQEADAAFREVASNPGNAERQAERNREERKKRLQQQQQALSGRAAVGGAGAFGQPSGFVGGNAGAFGAAKQAGSAFGTTSAFGSGAGTASAFGQPSGATTTSAFGQPSAFGSNTTPVATGSAFGSTSAFGSSAPPTTSAFGTNNIATPNPSSAFGSSKTETAPAFGGGVTSTAPAFGSTSFGSAPAQPSAFGSGSTTSAFGRSAFATCSTPTTFGNAAATKLHEDPYRASVPTKDQLTADVLSLFEKDSFEWGMVPFIEPPIDVR